MDYTIIISWASMAVLIYCMYLFYRFIIKEKYNEKQHNKYYNQPRVPKGWPNHNITNSKNNTNE
jgi:hypothetical protein